jgi:hypothetical protein
MWHYHEMHADECYNDLISHHPLDEEMFVGASWVRILWRAWNRPLASPIAIESREALKIDDTKDREEVASLIGLRSIPEREEANIDALIGMFDSTVESNEEVDVTEWVKSVRKRSA